MYDDARLPGWARWNPAAAERPWTVGVEEEVMLLDPRGWKPANRIDDALGALPDDLRPHVSAETHACVAELRTSPHATAASLGDELAGLRSGLRSALLAGLGLHVAAGGTHPLATDADVGVSPYARYREVDATTRVLAHREPTMAVHVHVGVPDATAAVRALDGLRADLPVLLALSANSPFWRGADSGFASIRTPLFSMFPRVGIPRHFGSYPRYVRVVERLLRSAAVPEPGFVWWDARLRPHLGTIEVRIMDAQTRVAGSVALAALVQCLVHRHAEVWRAPASESEILDENRYMAARDGMRAELVDGFAEHRRPVADALSEMADACRPAAAALGCLAELADTERLAADPGDAHQRSLAAEYGLSALPGLLSEEFAAQRTAGTDVSAGGPARSAP